MKTRLLTFVLAFLSLHAMAQEPVEFKLRWDGYLTERLSRIEVTDFSDVPYVADIDSAHGETVALLFLPEEIAEVKIYYDGIPILVPSDYWSYEAGTLTIMLDHVFVATAEDLDKVRENLTGRFLQVSDIDMAGRAWEPIGGYDPDTEVETLFQGLYDGNDFTISNLQIDRPEETFVGFFGINAGTIQYVHLISGQIDGSSFVGGICGFNGGTVRGCRIDSGLQVTGQDHNVGGICGINDNGILIACTNDAEVSVTLNKGIERSKLVFAEGETFLDDDFGSEGLGGICGNNSGQIVQCVNNGVVYIGVYFRNIGGVCGVNTGLIDGCSNNNSVAVGTRCIAVGGVCGQNDGDILSCHNTGRIMSGRQSEGVGGVCGKNGPEGKLAASLNTTSLNHQLANHGVGGVCGMNKGMILACANRSSIKLNEANTINIGGVCGLNEGKIIASYHAGTFTKSLKTCKSLGGICGDNSAGEVLASYWSDIDNSSKLKATEKGIDDANMMRFGACATCGWPDQTIPGWQINKGATFRDGYYWKSLGNPDLPESYPLLWWEE